MKQSVPSSAAARAFMRRATSISARPAGTSLSEVRSAAGISSKSSSMRRTPMASSISRTSCSVCGMNGIKYTLSESYRREMQRDALRLAALMGSVRLSLDLRLIHVGIEQRGDIARVVGADAHHPALAVRVFVDDLGAVAQALVDRHHLARHGAVDVGGGLHRFHHRAFLSRLHRAADLGQLDEHHVAQ